MQDRTALGPNLELHIDTDSVTDTLLFLADNGRFRIALSTNETLALIDYLGKNHSLGPFLEKLQELRVKQAFSSRISEEYRTKDSTSK